MTVSVPQAWYNVLADLPFPLPSDIPPAAGPAATGRAPQVPKSLVRHSESRRREVPIADEIGTAYESWRPTLLRRASRLEAALGTSARIYFKYEGGNISGSHKLNSAIAQAYYYSRAGVDRLVTGTGAGQWGTAMAAAAQMFGMDARVFMVALSFQQKPYRRTLMELFGAAVSPSPSTDTDTGRTFLATNPDGRGNLALAIAESLDDVARHPGSAFCIGSGENYSLLHQTVIGLEAREQLAEMGEHPDEIYASLGAGSNFGGISLPFIGAALRREAPAVRCVAVEPASCPKLTRGTYAYDYTDYSGTTPLEKMYTLGSRFVTPSIHAGGLRYHATSKLVSALYHHKLVEAEAYSQTDVFASGILFCRTEGILPAPESAHAIHATIAAARRATAEGTTPCLLVCVSGHGHFDLAAYADAAAGLLTDEIPTDEDYRTGLSGLPTFTPAG
jgi:tryptophan synthase beta chain